MTSNAVYVLKGYGQIDPAWARDCVLLFKMHQVNIRKLVLLKIGHPDCFSMLEIQFVLTTEGQDTFLKHLSGCLQKQTWNEQSLELL
jgi:hypothetical protein